MAIGEQRRDDWLADQGTAAGAPVEATDVADVDVVLSGGIGLVDILGSVGVEADKSVGLGVVAVARVYIDTSGQPWLAMAKILRTFELDFFPPD